MRAHLERLLAQAVTQRRCGACTAQRERESGLDGCALDESEDGGRLELLNRLLRKR